VIDRKPDYGCESPYDFQRVAHGAISDHGEIAMDSKPWPQNLIDSYPAVFGKTDGLAHVPVIWRDLLTGWAKELVDAGALAAGVWAHSVYSKYDSLRVDLYGGTNEQEKWDALAVLLEDRSELIYASHLPPQHQE
jgi:hypothetical protein